MALHGLASRGGPGAAFERAGLAVAAVCGLLRSAFHGRHAQVREKAGRIVVVFSVPNVRANSVQAGLAGHGASSLTETQAVG